MSATIGILIFLAVKLAGKFVEFIFGSKAKEFQTFNNWGGFAAVGGDLLGEVLRPESVNETTIANAIALLVRRGVLELAPEAPRKADVAYVQGPSFGELPALRERLAVALSAR